MIVFEELKWKNFLSTGNKFNRSEEHTSELQSHWYISYAVFCWYGKHRHLHSFPTRRSSDLYI